MTSWRVSQPEQGLISRFWKSSTGLIKTTSSALCRMITVCHFGVLPAEQVPAHLGSGHRGVSAAGLLWMPSPEYLYPEYIHGYEAPGWALLPPAVSLNSSLGGMLCLPRERAHARPYTLVSDATSH